MADGGGLSYLPLYDTALLYEQLAHFI